MLLFALGVALVVFGLLIWLGGNLPLGGLLIAVGIVCLVCAGSLA